MRVLWTWQTPKKSILSPCIGICELGEDGLCQGCYRSGEEIAIWSLMSDEQRLDLMETVLPARERQRG